MTWKCFRLVFRLETPLHIGYGAKLGIIDRTRYYVPGKTFWGAVVSKLGKEFCGDYKTLQKFVKDNLIFSYFYLSIDKEGRNIFLPQYTEEGLKYGNKKLEEFESEFLTSYVSTSIDKNFGTAEEGSLHEIELIKNKIDGKNVFLIGYLFAKENTAVRIDNGYIFLQMDRNKCFLNREKNLELFDLIKNLQIGGERNYGFGRIELKDVKLELDKVNLYNSEIYVELSNLYITPNGRRYIALSHVKRCGLEFNQLKGDLEPLVMREWDEKGIGQNPNFEGICIAPGSEFELKDGQKLKISDYGIWQINGQNQKKS